MAKRIPVNDSQSGSWSWSTDFGEDMSRQVDAAKAEADRAAAERAKVEGTKITLLNGTLTTSATPSATAKPGDLFVDVTDGSIYKV